MTLSCRIWGRLVPAAAMALLGACASAPRDSIALVDPVLADSVLQGAADQVRRCYRAPRVSSGARQIVTRLTVYLNPDGTLLMLPMIASQSGITAENATEAARVAEAASVAVVRCAPLRLPPEHYGLVWRSFDLTFSRKVRV